MFTVIKNYKKLFFALMQNHIENPEGISEAKFASGDELSDIKELQKVIKDWVLDKTESSIIMNSISEITWEAQNSLREITNSLLEKWFSTKNENEYNSFKKLVEKIDTVKMPEYSSIINKLNDNLNIYSPQRFHGITIKWDKISIHYDSMLSYEDTLVIRYDKNSWALKSDPQWIWWDVVDGYFNWTEYEVDSTILNDDIRDAQAKIEREEIKAQVLENKQRNLEQDKDDQILWEAITENAVDIKELWEQTEKALKDVKKILESHKEAIDWNTDLINELWEQTEKALKDVKKILESHKEAIDWNTDLINELWEQTEKALKDIKIILNNLIKNVNENSSDNARQNKKIAELEKQLDNHYKSISNLAAENIGQNQRTSRNEEQISANTTGINKINDRVTELHSDDELVVTVPWITPKPVVEVAPENKVMYEAAQKWYKTHGWLEGSHQILEIKKLLQESYDITKIDGKFNAEFFNSVIEYQKINELKIDWLVWRETFANMGKKHKNDLLDKRTESRDYYNVKKFEKSEKWYSTATTESIKKLQKALTEEWLGSSWFDIDWKFSYALMQKVIEFQELNSLTNDWLAWYNTLEELWLVDTKTEAKRFYI